ncbi:MULTISPECIES: EAL domain-containing protein [unclassified Sphingomonas]|uniref:EAL domain-containing protein n=1 Tax=unclassified Sphingomonas TaxID=196159 RepID=UPI00226AC9F9|nr:MULTISPECIES: EAL domain-containing protein [unclassified Sphingomonas]
MQFIVPFDETPPSGLAGVLRVLGLAENENDPATGTHLHRLNQVDAVWPIAIGAQALAATAFPIAAYLAHDAGSTARMAVNGAGLLLIACGILALLRLPVLRDRSTFLRTRGVALAAAMLALAQSCLLWSCLTLPTGPIRLSCFVAMVGAIAIGAITLHPVRSATLALASGLVAGVAFLSASLVTIGVAIGFLACLWAAILRLARLDLKSSIDQLRDGYRSQRAAKMVAEFEQHGTGWFWEANRDGRLTYVSAKVGSELTAAGIAPLGRTLTDIFRMDSDAPGTERTLAFHVSSRTSFSDYSVCAAPDTSGERWWSISGRPVVDELGRFQGFIGSGSDLTERRRSEAEITRLALFDSLTGLANRQRMRLSLDKTLAPSAGPYRATALFLMDLDRFKAVNDTLGHQAGDALLKQVAQRLQRGVGDNGLVGRIGGDEFQVLLPGMDSREALSELARDLIASLSQPYFIAGASVAIGCSIGIAITPQHGEDAETLIRNADLALYAAKGDGRGVHRFYSNDMLAGAQSRKQLEDDMRAALTNGAFHLVYQPVVRTADERIAGFEALMRWDHPVRGPISPADFIPVAEECGLIEAMGEWALRTACIEAASWPPGVRVAVNVSPIQFANPALPALVTSALASAGLDPDRLELEITEGVFLDETASSERMFKALKGIGVRLALDDFGTGYSSFGYLRTAPFDKIKIDQSFVREAAVAGNRNAAIIKAIVTLADTLGMETTAEGVEVQDEIDLLRALGCTNIQGYVYGRGMRAETVREQLGIAEGRAQATGHKVSRAPRTKMLRSARIAIDDQEGDVRIRDISSGGAMIEGIAIEGDAVGLAVTIELLENQMFPARIRWIRNGRAGLAFDTPFALERLNPAQTMRAARRTG